MGRTGSIRKLRCTVALINIKGTVDVNLRDLYLKRVISVAQRCPWSFCWSMLWKIIKGLLLIKDKYKIYICKQVEIVRSCNWLNRSTICVVRMVFFILCECWWFSLCSCAIKPNVYSQTRYMQTDNQLSRSGLSRPLVVPAWHAIFLQKVFDCHLTDTCWG